MWDITIDPPSRPNVLASTSSFLQSMWDRHQIHPPSGPSVLTGTSPHVYPLRGTTRKGVLSMSEILIVCRLSLLFIAMVTVTVMLVQGVLPMAACP